MPGDPGLAQRAAEVLRRRPQGAGLGEIATALEKRGGEPVLRHSLRAAIYQRLGDGDPPRFERVGRGRYKLRGGT